MPLYLKNNKVISSSDVTSVGVFKSKINRDQLLYSLDAADIDSYPGSSYTWYDLSGNGRNGYVRGTVTWGATYGGYFETGANQTTNYIELPESAPQNLTDGLIFSIEWWATMKDTSAGRYQQSMVNSGGGNLFIIGKDATSFSIYAVSLVSGTAPTYSVGTPAQFVVTSNGTNQFFYKNGQLTSIWGAPLSEIKSTGGYILDQEQDSAKGSFDANQNTYGWWHITRMYNKCLHAYEVAENFQAVRGRFSL